MVQRPSRRPSPRAARTALVVLAAFAPACACSGPDDVDGAGVDAPVTRAIADPACAAVSPGLHEIVLTAGGGDHPVRIVVPRSFGGSRLPAVIGWHGLGISGAGQASLSGYEALAEAEGFIAVHPTGIGSAVDPRPGWHLRNQPEDAPRDDVEFARALVDALVAGWCAEPTRIYATGMSNGGFFTARLVCELSDRIAAAVSVAGLFFPDRCAPARGVPYMAFHGTADDFVPYDGSGESVLLAPGMPPMPPEFFDTVIPEEFAAFASLHGCLAEPETAELGSVFVTRMIRRTYLGCRDELPLVFVEVVDGGHTWPGSAGVRAAPLDATRDGWEFMREFAL